MIDWASFSHFWCWRASPRLPRTQTRLIAENMRAYSRFGNDYVNVHPNDLFLAVPFGGTGDRVPGKARSKFEKGNQFLLKDQFDKAKQQYEAALADYPDYASARLNLGVAELNLKDAGHAGFVNLIWPLLIVSFGPTPTLVVRLVEKPAAVGAVGKMGIARVVRDFQGRWEGRKTCFWFSSLSTDRLFPQPGGRRVFVSAKIMNSSLNFCGLLARVKPQNIVGGVAPSGSNTCSNGRCSTGFLVPKTGFLVPKLTSNSIGLLPRLSKVTMSAWFLPTFVLLDARPEWLRPISRARRNAVSWS